MKRIALLVMLGVALLGVTSFAAVAQPSRLVIAAQTEPVSLDAHKASGSSILSLFGATLVALDPVTGEPVPYLAKSWTVSADGLTWDFALRDDVTFHDGTPLTAADYAWTFTRWLDPATASPTVAAYSAIKSAEALEGNVLRLTLYAPFFPLLHSLANAFAQPLPQAAVEAMGDDFARKPIGVGPFKVVEWVPGDHLLLERNAAFNWGPAFLQAGAPNVDQVEIRFSTEYATTLAGLQAGEIDTVLDIMVNPLDVPALQSAGFSIIDVLAGGMNPYVLMNTSKPPFDDINVRKAFNLALDKDALIAVAAGGNAVPQYGPISASVAGYAPEVEASGYHYDLDAAKAAMAAAGYTPNANGILEKDGQPLALTLMLTPNFATLAQVLQDQYKQLGVDLTLQQADFGTLFGAAVGGEYQLAVGFYDYDEADILYIFYHSSSLGALNVSQINDPTLDAILARTRTETDPAARQAAVTEAQEYIMQQAYVAPIYTPRISVPVSSRVQGLIVSADGSDFYLNNVTLAQ